MTRVALLYVYHDDEPSIILNPPRNLQRLLNQWLKIDRKYCETGQEPEDWEPVDAWLKKRGVVFLKPRIFNVF